MDFARDLLHDNFVGDRCRTTTAEPVKILDRLDLRWDSEFTVEKDAFDWTMVSFRLVLLFADIGATVDDCGIFINDDFDDTGRCVICDLVFFLFGVSGDSFRTSPMKAVLLTSGDSMKSSLWGEEVLSGEFGSTDTANTGDMLGRKKLTVGWIIILLSTRICTDLFAVGFFVDVDIGIVLVVVIAVSLSINCCSLLTSD